MSTSRDQATIPSTTLRGMSCIASAFFLRWSTIPHAPPLVPEYRFCDRRWRFDFAHPDSKLAIEIDGGIWRGSRGGHTSGTGFARDREKDFEAAMGGWTVLRLTPEMARDRALLERIVAWIARCL